MSATLSSLDSHLDSATSETDDTAVLVDAVESDPELSAIEKELVIRTSFADDDLDVFTEIPSITRGLIRNPQFDAERWRVLSETGCEMVNDDDIEIRELVNDGYSIVGVWGSLPTASLSIKSTQRSSSYFGQIVSPP